MKAIRLELQDNVVSVYDQTKTTVLGRAAQKTIGGELVTAPPLTKFIDVFTDTGQTPQAIQITSNGRMFVLGAITAGAAQVLCYSLNLNTLAHAFVGRVQITLPNLAATTHTVRGFRVIDNGATGWKVFVATTGSVLVNGGVFLANELTLADFVQVGFPTIPFATGLNQKAMYFLQDQAATGATHTNTASVGIFLDQANSRVWVHNGVSATHQYRGWQYSTSPDNPGQAVTSFTIATPGKVNRVGHGYLVNDQVTFSTTGVLPTGIVAGTVYFVRNPTANDFEISATSGGASIAFTGTQSGVATVRRAFGIANNLPYVATGNLPALAGTLLAVNSEYGRTAGSGLNAGQFVVSFATTTGLYQGRVNELTAAATTWPSLETVNLTGGSGEIVSPVPVNFVHSELLDRYIYGTAQVVFVAKQFVNSVITNIFGRGIVTSLEGVSFDTVDFGAVSFNSLDVEQGILAMSSTRVGQRGVVVMDLRSHSDFDYSAVISRVITIDNAGLRFISTLEQLFDVTGTMRFFYRTSGFGVATGGWTEIYTAEDLSMVASAQQIQFKVLFDIANAAYSTPAQLHDLILGTLPLDEMSEYWAGSVDDTATGSPSRTAFEQIKLTPGAHPEYIFTARRVDNGSLVVQASTVADAASFEFSSNSGTSWAALGTIPNAVGTTRLRYNWASPPGVEVVCSLLEANA